ncbi:MAG: metallophosphoesterase [Acidimicrobiales bacterium]
MTGRARPVRVADVTAPQARPVRVAAVGDVHVGADSRATLAPALRGVEQRADVLLLAGDLTRCGSPAEAAVLADELRDVTIPVVGVLGNHDHHDGRDEALVAALEAAGVTILEGTAVRIELDDGRSLGVAGVKGFGGGFPPTAVSPSASGSSRRSSGTPPMPRTSCAPPSTAWPAATPGWRCCTTPRFATPSKGNRRRSTPSSAASCSARRWTPPAPTSSCTAMRTTGASAAPHRPDSPFATWPCP